MSALETGVRPMQMDIMQQVAVLPAVQEFQNEPLRIETQPRQWKYEEDQREIEQKCSNYMEEPWGAFGQIMLAQEMDGPTGGKVKKIVAVSIPYPSGTTGGMIKEILRRTMELNKPSFEEWDGEEGKLVATKKKIPDGTIDLNVLHNFIHASREVIVERHAYPESESVQHFFAQHTARENQMSVVERDAKKILGTSEFLEISAFNKEYENAGIILMEGFIDEEGLWWGMNPKRERALVANIASNESHDRSLQWLAGTLPQEGNLMVGNGDSTIDVSICDGAVASGACSDFFRAQEEGFDTLKTTATSGEKVIFTPTSQRETTYTHTSGGGWIEPKEDGCRFGHAKGKCDCNQAAEEASGGE